MEEQEMIWIRIATDPLERSLHKAISLGDHGVVFEGFAAKVPVDWLESNECGDPRLFVVVDDDEVSDLEREAWEHNQSRNAALREEAKAAAATRAEARRKAALAMEIASQMTTSGIDSQDD